MKTVKPRLSKLTSVWVAKSRGHTRGYGDTPESAVADFEAHRGRRSRLSTLLLGWRDLQRKVEQSKREALLDRAESQRLRVEADRLRVEAERAREAATSAEARLETADDRARKALEDELTKREQTMRMRYEPYRTEYERLVAERREESRKRRATDVRFTADRL